MTRPARTQTARKKIVRPFLDWWAKQPMYIAFWFIPFVAMLFLIAIIKNFITGDKK